jgi:hypothetical protein
MIQPTRLFTPSVYFRCIEVRAGVHPILLSYDRCGGISDNNAFSTALSFALHNKELHNLYSSPSIIRTIKSRRMRWTGHVTRIADKRNAYRLFVGKAEGMRPLGRPRRRWVDNIKIDLREIGWAGVDWIDMAQDRDQWRALVNTVLNFRVP